MISEVNGILSGDYHNVDHLKSALICCKDHLQQLKGYVLTNAFESKEEEIRFFKAIKPKFQCQLIYYSKLYLIQLNRPEGSNEVRRQYLLKELYKLRLFFESHTSFYHYHRSKETFLDEQYFLRDNAGRVPLAAPTYLDADPSFSTGYDYQTSRILANELLSNFLNAELSALDNRSDAEKATVPNSLVWSESKVAFAELLYALHASGTFNNSQADIKTMAEFLGVVFNVKIGNIYKVFEEIRIRKKNRTAFLDSLRQNLIQRMERDDDQAL